MHFKSYLMFTASLYQPRILHWLKEPGRGKKLKSMFYTTGIFDSKRLYKSYRGKKGSRHRNPLILLSLRAGAVSTKSSTISYVMSVCYMAHTNKVHTKSFTIKMKIFIQEVQIWWYQPSLKAITMRQRGHKLKSLAQSIWKPSVLQIAS